jgi:opacity protein-like surface antigen
MKAKSIITAIVLAVLGIARVQAQDVAVKTDLLKDVVLTPTIGVEFGLAPKWTFEVSGSLNAWPVNDHYWKQWMVMPEARYWFCQRFAGHFVGAHVLGGQYNFGNLHNNIKFLGTDFSKLTDERHQGWMVGAGIAYGYDWILSRHWNLEAEIGFGWVYTRYDVYPCATCGSKTRSRKPHNYVGPTKAAINLVYTF